MSRDDFLTFALGQGVRTAALPADFSLLITDTLESPGTFLLTHFISRALRQPRKTLLVGFSHTFEHYSAILKKSVGCSASLGAVAGLKPALQGIQLANERTFTFVDANDVGNTLLELYLSIEVALSAMEGALVVLDDLSSLLWAGHPAREVAQLFANVRALVSQVSRRFFGVTPWLIFLHCSLEDLSWYFNMATISSRSGIRTTPTSSAGACNRAISGCRPLVFLLRLEERCTSSLPSCRTSPDFACSWRSTADRPWWTTLGSWNDLARRRCSTNWRRRALCSR